jgi:hypothetical protein
MLDPTEQAFSTWGLGHVQWIQWLRLAHSTGPKWIGIPYPRTGNIPVIEISSFYWTQLNRCFSPEDGGIPVIEISSFCRTQLNWYLSPEDWDSFSHQNIVFMLLGYKTFEEVQKTGNIHSICSAVLQSSGDLSYIVYKHSACSKNSGKLCSVQLSFLEWAAKSGLILKFWVHNVILTVE